MSPTRPLSFFLATAALLVAGCGGGDEANTTGAVVGNEVKAAEVPDRTIAQALEQSADHSTFRQAITVAGLEATMAGAQPYTVFAPTNAAFEKIPEAERMGLMQENNRGQLTAILTAHIVPGVVTARDLAEAIEKGNGRTEIATVGGGNLVATREGDTIVIAGGGDSRARVSQADLLGSNGVVHAIDTVLAPGEPPEADAQ